MEPVGKWSRRKRSYLTSYIDRGLFSINGVLRTVLQLLVTAPDGRKLSYAELAAAADLHREATAQTRPKPASAHRIVGKSIARRDIPAKVMGGVAFVLTALCIATAAPSAQAAVRCFRWSDASG